MIRFDIFSSITRLEFSIHRSDGKYNNLEFFNVWFYKGDPLLIDGGFDMSRNDINDNAS
jgi:hypothetical protein